MEVQDEIRIDTLQLKKAALILRAINHKLRQQMLKLIHERGKITVKEIYCKLRLEQSVASQHLSILRKAGFVTTVKNGQSIIYSVDKGVLEKVHKEVYDLLNKSN